MCVHGAFVSVGQRGRTTRSTRSKYGLLLSIAARAFSPDTLLFFIHPGIQGEELRTLRHALPQLNRCVRRLIVATHSRRIHCALRRLLVAARWRRVYDFRLRARERTEFGDIQFLDGMLAFENSAAFEHRARKQWVGLEEIAPAGPSRGRPEPSPG